MAEMVQISEAQLSNMMGFQKQYIDEKEKKVQLEDELKKSVSCWSHLVVNI